MKTYRVVVNFSFIGADDEFYVEAESENEAKEIALDLASENLDVAYVDYNYDDAYVDYNYDDADDSVVIDYAITINFGFVGCDEEYIVDATSEDEAIATALQWAKDELRVESIEEYDEEGR